MTSIKTLKELCSLLKGVTNSGLYELYFSQFYTSIKEIDLISVVEGFSLHDMDDLCLYSKCRVLCIYEYICKEYGIVVDREIQDTCKDWYCPIQETSLYLSLKDIVVNKEMLELTCRHQVLDSIEPFRSRGIPALVFNPTV